MNVGEIVYKILGDDADFKKVMGNVGKLATKTMSVIAEAALAASAAAATAVGVLAKEAVASFGDYEQLAGGAELMFGEAYDFIAEKAKTAYKDIQMSQNDYLEQVNGFAIGLKTAMGGDEVGAAKLADRIVAAEADIVAATGNTAENVQNAFNGIMKNNYTMLDNLQIGITPTKEGFQELIDKVNAYKEAHGEATKYTIDNLADCQNALVDYIEMQGLAGYAQAEGADTLQGSMASMTAAWQNMLTGMADPTQDFEELVSNLIDSVLNVSDNLIPRIEAVLPQMATGVTQLAEGILPLIPDTLNAMLPDVIDGANSLIAALLDTLSSIADTAIPIVTENADEIIDTLLTGLVSAIPNLASSAADLCTALITAILDNADIITQGAVDVVVALAEGISQNAEQLIDAAVDAVFVIADTLIDNIDLIIDAAADLIEALGTALIDHIPDIVLKAPEIVIGIAGGIIASSYKIVSAAEEIIKQIGETLVNYDWVNEGATVVDNINQALSNAIVGGVTAIMEATGTDIVDRQLTDYSNLTKESIEKMISTSESKLDELERVWLNWQRNGVMQNVPEWIRRGAEESNQSLEMYIGEQITGTEDLLNSLQASYDKAETEAEKHERKMEEIRNNGQGINSIYGDDAAKRAEEEAKKHFEGLDKATSEEVENLILTGDELKEAVTAIDNAYALGNYDSEKQYWADRLALLEANRNEEDQQWIKYYSQTKQHYEKAVKTENKAQEQAKKEAVTKLKESVENKFRELETEQLQKGYDDSWLLEQERVFLETLDHNSEAYKDFNLKLLKEQKSTDEKAAKEAETAAKKQRDAVEKSYDSIVKSRDSLAKSLSSGGDIFSSSEETDKRTGAKTKKRSIDLAGFEKKIEAKKKLTSKIAELIEKNTPDDIITELLKQDPEDALAFANELLKSPDKLKKLSEGIQNDDAYSKIIANMVTENSDEFRQLGTDAGTVFGEGFMAAFQANWEESFKSVFDDDYVDTAAANVTAANSSAGISANTAAANTAASDSSEATTKKSSGTSGGTSSGTYRVVDINGKYVATVVNNENARSARTGGR